MRVVLEFDKALIGRIEAVFPEETRAEDMARAVLVAVGTHEMRLEEELETRGMRERMENNATRINRELGLVEPSDGN